jgi:lipopolysaccharide biosynthesis protein
MKHCILLHLYYQDLWPEFKSKLQPILNENVHLYVTITEDNTQYTDDIKSIAQEVFLVENRGMDVGPFIYAYNKVKNFGYITYLKLQSKKSLHSPGIGDEWRQLLYYPIVDNYEFIIDKIKNVNYPIILGQKYFYYDEEKEPKNNPNRVAAKKFIDKATSILKITDDGSFFAGTMFLTNSNYLEKLFNNIDLNKLYYEFELGYHRDSLAHGMERVLGYGIQYYEGTYIVV